MSDKSSTIPDAGEETSVHNCNNKKNVYGEYYIQSSDTKHLIKSEFDVLTWMQKMLLNN